MLLSARWVLPIEGPPIEDGAVLVREGRIAAVGPKGSVESQAAPDDERRRFESAVIMPGFVDLHTHLKFSVFRGLCDDLGYARWKLHVSERARALAPDDWCASARLGALEAIRSGITCVADMSSTSHGLDAALEGGIRGVFYREVDGMDHSQVDRLLADAESYVLEARERARVAPVDIGIAPHGPYAASSEVFSGCAKMADRLGLPVATHLAGSRDEYEFVKYGSSLLANEYRDQQGWADFPWQPMGVSPVKYVLQWQLFGCDNVLAAHAIHVDEQDLATLARYDVSIAHCPRCAAKLGMGVAPLTSYLEHGLRVGMGTDSPASNNTMDMFDEMRVGLLIQRAANQTVDDFSAERFVRMATLGGAEALRLEKDIGSLEVGKAADLIAVDLSHARQLPMQADPYSALVYTANQDNVLLTMVDGKVLFSEGAFATFDHDAVLAASGPVRAKLRG